MAAQAATASQDNPDLLTTVAARVADADDLQSLSQPLLEILQQLTGLPSVYLTEIDWAAAQQHILYARNDGTMTIPEGLVVPWSDTLCRRALDEGRRITTDVADHWGDSDAARTLGIRTYVSVPVRDRSGSVLGTLCGAGDQCVTVPERTLPVMELFAQLIAYQAQREREADRARARAAAAERTAAVFEALSEIGECCSRAESLAGALRACADKLTGLYPEATVTPLLAEAAGEPWPTAGDGPALAWIEARLAAGGLTDGAAWWTRGQPAWGNDRLAQIAAPDSASLGVACALHRGRVHGALLMQAPAAAAVDSAMPEAMTTVALHLSLLTSRLHLTRSLQASQQRLEQQARLDPLTGLGNRRQLEEEAERIGARIHRHGGCACAAFIDLDGFKAINDEHGHDAGDRFLIEIARRLRTTVRTEELTARYGGDEFVVLGQVDESNDHAARAEAMKARLAAVLQGDFDLDGVDLTYAGPSIGVAIQRDGESLRALIQRADEAMYREKMARRA